VFTRLTLPSAFLSDDAAFLEHTPPSSSVGDREGGDVTLVSSAPVAALAPSLTPASQPTISLLTDNSAETLSVESLTLLPPSDSPHLHPCTSHTPATLSLQRPDAAIAEEEEEEEDDEEGEGDRKEEELQEEEGSPEEDTVREETTDEAAKEVEEGDEDARVEVNSDQQATEYVTEDTDVHSDTPDSPELD